MLDYDKIHVLEERIKDLVEDFFPEEVSLRVDLVSKNENSIQFRLNISKPECVLDPINTLLSQKVGFTQNVVGMEFENSKGEKFVINSINLRALKYKVIATSTVRNKSFKYTAGQIKSYLGGDKQINRLSNLDNLIG